MPAGLRFFAVSQDVIFGAVGKKTGPLPFAGFVIPIFGAWMERTAAGIRLKS